jgi:hypothetical protein
MKVFHCDHCQHLIFFENVQCLKCQHTLAYLPDLGIVGSLDAAEGGVWTTPLPRAKGRTYKLCSNYTNQTVCNWAIPADDPNELCQSCQLTTTIPDLTVPGHRDAWYKLEVAKRRLIYTLQSLKLPITSRKEDPVNGLAFEFLGETPQLNVLTGHASGLITLNIAEADDAERERRRLQMYEPYRTIVGHFRHEIGHYYWDVLIRDTDKLAQYRELFGDERADYGEALQRHYNTGAPAGWQEQFVTTYASAHPWEDWAECWAHYLHMTDTLETAADCGVRLRPDHRKEPTLKSIADPVTDAPDFEELLQNWFALTYLLNNLNRGLGLPDGYPFVLSEPVTTKLRFVHDVIRGQRENPTTRSSTVSDRVNGPTM